MAFIFLVIEDEARVAAQRREALARFGIRTYVVPSFMRAKEALESWTFDAIVLSASTLGSHFLVLLKTLRAYGGSPVLVLVDRYDEADQIAALESGATDVMESSASPELVAVKLLRLLDVRSEPPRSATVLAQNVGSLELDERTGLATVDGMALALTRYQFQLVSLLASKSGEVVSREEVRNILMGTSDIRVVDVQVSRIRKKLKVMNVNDIVLRTIRGRGYSLMTSPRGRETGGIRREIGWSDQFTP